MVYIPVTQSTHGASTNQRIKKKNKATFNPTSSGKTPQATSATAAEASHLTAVVSMSNEDKTDLPANFEEHSFQALDILEEIHKDFVANINSDKPIESLKKLAATFPKVDNDPQLKQLKELIEIRISVELAKRGAY